MQQILDLHIHSKYSRACSSALTLPNIEATCRIKGVDIVATGDFTHPAWFASIENELEEIPHLNPLLNKERETGLYKLKSAEDSRIKFILSTELALIYKDGEKVRRIHLMVHAPSLKSVRELNRELGKKYNIKSDGRPILGMKAPDLVKLCLNIDPRFLIYPAHIWTPWFSVFGSKSGFDSMEECFREQTENIYAFETGLSSDPEMNWRLSSLDKLTLLSNSDAHSLPNIGREANVFAMERISYNEIYDIIKNKKVYQKNKSGVKYTIEFYPEEGMYHYDGHRNCGIGLNPEETKKEKGICPVCKKPLVIGVLNRVQELADRPSGFKPEGAPGFKKLIELDKIIAEAFDIKSRHSQKVQKEYDSLIKKAGSELFILIDADLETVKAYFHPAVAEGIKRMRAGDLYIKPGFDGQYGEIKIFNEKEKEKYRQQSLF